MQEPGQSLADLSYQEMPTEAAEELSRWFATEEVLRDVHNERASQHAQWGDQDIPMGGSVAKFKGLADQYRETTQAKHASGRLTYADVLLEEVFEALAEEDPLKMDDELVQVAAVCVKMAELIRRHRNTPQPAGV